MLYGECPTNREQPQKKIATAAYPSIRRERRKYACVQRKRGKTRKRSVQHTAGKPTKAVRAFKSADGFKFIELYSLINSTPKVFLPQWLVTILPATVSQTSLKSKLCATNCTARSTSSLSAELWVIKHLVPSYLGYCVFKSSI